MTTHEENAEIPRWKRELLIASITVAIGFLALPVAVYWVGQKTIGEYAPDAGALVLAEAIWSDVLSLDPAAWLLVLSPYVIVQLARLARLIWRAPEGVTTFTDPSRDR
jgi:hypothetical protein